MSEPPLPYGRRGHADPVAGRPALELEGVSVAYERSDALALCCVDLSVAVGARVALVGANGAGKSTLLKAVAGLLPVRAGEISIAGLPVGACHHRVAYLPQRTEIDWAFPITVGQLVLTGRYVHVGWLRRRGRVDRAIAAEALERIGLGKLAGCQIGRLSGGQQQRVLLARALAQEAELLLLDEPLNAVDPRTQQVVMAILGDLQAEGKTAIVSTHDLGRLEAEFDDVARLDVGRVASRELAWTG